MPSIFERILETVGALGQVRADITALQAQMEWVMAQQEVFDDRMKQIDAATSEIASDLAALREQLTNREPISDANLAILDAKIARLKVLGADPENPVPPVV